MAPQGLPDELETTLEVVPVDPWPAPPIGPMPPGEGDSLATTPHKSTSERTTTTLVAYEFFFSHLNHLDKEADRQTALGNEAAAKLWRSHEQLAAGLDAQEANALKNVAFDCNKSLAKKDTEIRIVAKAFQQANATQGSRSLTPSSDLQVLWQDRVQIINQHIDRLRSLIGEERFQALDTYIRANFAPIRVFAGLGRSERRIAMSRTIFATILLGLSTATSSFADSSISLASHMTILANGQAMVECLTKMDDATTISNYSSVYADCGIYLEGSRINHANCGPATPTADCSNTYATIPGQDYTSHSEHALVPNGCPGGYYDPLTYGIPVGTDLTPYFFGETAKRTGTPNSLPCRPIDQNGTSLLLGYTTSATKLTTRISPSQVTLYDSQTQQFSADKSSVDWSLVQGNGTFVGGLYTVPATFADGESAIVQACDSQNLVDCARATITLKKGTLTISPAGPEVLPIPDSNPPTTINFKATLLPSTLNQAVKWSQTPTGIGSINPDTGVYTPPNNADLTESSPIIVKACSVVTSTLCNTTTVSIPKVGITVTLPSGLLASPGNTLTVGANAFGPVSAPEVIWTVSPGTFAPQGFNTILYTPPATPTPAAQAVTFTACLKASATAPANHQICASPSPTMMLVPPITITSPGTWNAGATSSITITGTGFGDAPNVTLSDPTLIYSIVSRSNTSIVLNVTLPVSSGSQPLIVTVSSTTAGVTPPPASVTVIPAKAVLTISPVSATLREGQSQTFTTGCTSGGVLCTAPSTPTWLAVLGSFSPPGAITTNYTAPASVNAPTVIPVLGCWSVVPQQCATALVTVNPLTVTVTPTTANVNGCSTKQFTVQVANASVTTVTWDVVPPVGNVDGNGFYTAPCPVTAEAQIQVRACSTANTQRCGISNVTLKPVNVTVDPPSASVQAGGFQQFSTVVLNTTNLGVNWTLTPPGSASGTIDANGYYQAPNVITVTPVTVTATSKADNVTKGTALVTLVSANAVFAPSTLTFAAQDVGTTSAAQTITLSNPGTAAFSISSLATTGEFSQTNTCGASLAAGASCTINVQFTPTAMGVRTGTLRITDTAPGSPHIASLNGNGRGPGASLNPTALDLGGQRAGFATAAQTVTLANTGTGPMSIASISVDGEFTQTNTCGSTLAAGASCAISVSFQPAVSSLGQRTGTLRVADSAPGSPHTASLTGVVLGGSHDNALCDGSNGWAWDSSRPSTPINVYIFEGNNLLATVLANQYRGDLVATLGNGYHGFSWPMLPSLRDGQSHTVTIRFNPDANAVPIPGSPKSVTCAPTPVYQGYQDAANCQILSGWGWDSTQPNLPITLYIFQGNQYLDSVPANQYRQDLAGSGIGNGYHAFIWSVPSTLIDGQQHSLSVHFDGTATSQSLIGSPMSITCNPGQPPTVSIAWVQPAESSWGVPGTLTAAGYAANGTGGVQLAWRERSSAGVWGGWTTVSYQAPIGADTVWSNTISSGNPTDKCHWFEAQASYFGATSAVYQYTGAPGCP